MSNTFMRIGKTVAKVQAGIVMLGMLTFFPMTPAGAVDLAPQNPELSGSCGLDITLVMDTSGSISNGELATMRTALKGFVDALAGTPSMFALVRFDDTASTPQGFTADADLVKGAIDAADGSGATNWEDGLLEAADTFDPRAGKENVVIFASDGNPTVNNGSTATPGTTDGNDLSNAVLAADDIKSGASISGGAATRVITIGIGDGVNQSNLEAISSSQASGGYFGADDFDDLEAALANIAEELCGGTLNIQKNVDGEPAADWTFIVDGGEYTTDETGSVSIELDADSYSVQEIGKEGFELDSATCTIGQEETGSLDGLTVYSVEVDDENITTCVFNNETIENSATVYADKVICESEIYLPNWSGADMVIDANTAEDYVSQINSQNEAEVCWLADWDFQWAAGDVGNPGDNIEEAGEPWTTFGSSVVIPNPDGGTFWFREFLPEGWLPFTGVEGSDVSAEFYCGSDVLHYDNFDFVEGVNDDDVIYCVGFNVDLTPDEDLPECSDGIDNGDGEDSLPDSEDPGCWSEPGNPESYDPNDDDETDTSSSEDVCPNLEGVQSEIPEGYFWEEDDQECDKESSGGGGGGRRRGGGDNDGEVLGAATCGPLLTQYLHKDWANSPDEVTKLQNFLNQYMSAGLPVNGVFGMDVFEAVKAFQVAYGSDVLIPWVGFPASGISAENTPTGFVYQTTKWKINNIWCPGSEAFPATLI